VVDTVPLKPCAGSERSAIAAATPATYRPHAGRTADGSSTGSAKRTSPSKSLLVNATCSLRSNSMVVSRSIAMGKTSPPV